MSDKFRSFKPEAILKPVNDVGNGITAMSALKNFFFFCLNVLGIDFTWFHREWHDYYMKNKSTYIISSRRHAKSTWTQTLGIWEALRSRKTILVVMNSGPQTAEWMRYCLAMLQDAVYRLENGMRITTEVLKYEDVGEEITQESIGRIALSNGSVIYGRSLGGKIRGINADIIILDDLLDKKMNMSFEEAEHIFRAVILGVREDHTKVIYVGTILKEGDALHKLHTGEIGNGLFVGDKYPAIISWERQEVIWPELRHWQYLMDQRDLVGELDFQIEYMLDPLSDKLSLVPRHVSDKCKNNDLVLGRERDPKAQAVVIGVDLQISPSDSADYTVLLALELMPETEDEESVWRILDMKRMRVGDGEDEIKQKEELEDMARFYNANEVKIESVGFQRYFGNDVRRSDLKFYTDIEDHDTRGEKHDKQIGIPSLRKLFKQRVIEIPWADNNVHTKDEIVYTRDAMEIFIAELAGWQYDREKNKFISRARNDDCLHPKTLIKSKRGWLEIEDIEIGDLVLTHKNRYKKVLKIGKRKVRENEKIYEIKAVGKLPIIISENHPFYVSKQKINWKDRSNTIYFDSFNWVDSNKLELLKPRQCHTSLYPVNSLEEEYTIDLYKYSPKSYKEKNKKLISIISGSKINNNEKINPSCNPIDRYLTVDDNFALIMGLFASDGCVGKHNVSFSGNQKEIGIRRFLKTYFKEMGMNVWSKNTTNDKKYNIGYSNNCLNPMGYVLSFGSMPLRNFFATFGKRENKKYPLWVEFLPIRLQENVLFGHIAGDGSLANGRLTIATISEKMGYQLFDMFIRCGYRPCLSKNTSKKKKHKDHYCIRFGKNETNKIIDKLPKQLFEGKKIVRINVVNRDDNSVKSDGEFIYSKFKQKKNVDYNDFLYNLQVEQDESYIANGYIVHNCTMAFWFAVLSARKIIDEGYDVIDHF